MKAVVLILVPWRRPPRYKRLLHADPCSYCGLQPSGTADHVQPRAAGGSTDERNLVGACPGCNQAKADRALLAFLLTTATGERMAR